MNKKKKIIISVSIFMILLLVFVIFLLINKSKNSIETNAEVSKLKELPKPEISGGARGELGIDKNINEVTIDEYLNREDSVYRDMRMLEDPGNYEKIGGDRFLSGYVEGFEVIPLPYIIPVPKLPSEVGDTYTGTTLFWDDDGKYMANYEESMDIIEQIFPKDKVIFLMCGGGGYSGITKNFLVSMGWDENKIYNIGGYWYYKGNHSVNVKKELDGVVSYDFENVPYHNIEFDKLTKSANYREPKIKVTELKINTSKIEIEEGNSFKLNVIVLPNQATNKEIKWSSSNELVASVSGEGLVHAMGEGNAIITVETIDGNKTISCKVTVNKKEQSNHIKLDNVLQEANEFASYDIGKITKEFEDTVNNPNGVQKDEYSVVTSDGGRQVNDLWREEYGRYQKKLEQATNKRVDILNKLIDNKKSFIILIHTKECEEREYSVVEGAEKILKQNNYFYLNISYPTLNGEETLEKSKLNVNKLNGGSIAIVKDGEIYASINPDVDAIKNDKETKNWLSTYIDIK